MIFEVIIDLIVQYRKRIAFFIVIISVLGISILGYLAVTRAGKMAVDVHVVPSDAKVTIDGKKAFLFTNTGTTYVKPGEYTVIVEKTGYEKYETKLTFDDTRNMIVRSLAPISDEAKEWAKQHEADYQQNERYGGDVARQNGQHFFKNNPLARQLPIQDPYYQIGYITGEDNQATITINTPSPRYRYFAVKRLESLGYSAADYEVVFKDYKNPLESK